MGGRIELSVQGRVRDQSMWLALARAAEEAGCDALYVADHPGTAAAPFVALAAAASVTERIRLGTCVVNAGLWESLSLAAEIATLDVVSHGRAVLGLGAGHTPSEWAMTGRSMPPAAARVDRLIEVTRVVRDLLRGASVTTGDGQVELDGAQLGDLRPVQLPIPLMVGGNGPVCCGSPRRRLTSSGSVGWVAPCLMVTPMKWRGGARLWTGRSTQCASPRP